MSLDELKTIIDNAIEIKDLPLKNEIDSSDYFEICTTNGESYRAAVLQMLVQPFTQAISGVNGNITIPISLNRLPISVTAVDTEGNIVDVAISISTSAVQVQWNGSFTGEIIIL